MGVYHIGLEFILSNSNFSLFVYHEILQLKQLHTLNSNLDCLKFNYPKWLHDILDVDYQFMKKYFSSHRVSINFDTHGLMHELINYLN